MNDELISASNEWRKFSGTVPINGTSVEALEDFERIDAIMWQQ